MNDNDANIKLQVEGMTCSGCEKTVTTYLQKEGLHNINVSFATSEVVFGSVQPEKLQAIKNGINNLGYHVVEQGAKSSGKLFSLENIFIFCATLTVPLLLHMFLPFHILHNQWFQLALATPVFIVGWFHFGRGAIGSVRVGMPNMDVLILIGATAAYVYSLAGTIMQLGNDYLFYETAATIITLVLLGNLIEKRTIKETTTSIDSLAKLKPDKANLVIDVNGFEMHDIIEADKVKTGDIIRINTGDRVPLDGVIISGNAFTDESMITGESVPVEKQKGDKVISGTLISQGNIKVSVTATAGNSYLAKLIELIKTAHAQKPNIQKFADRISNVFVPVVVGLSVLTFLIAHFVFDITATKALLNSIAVLAIACPCAMGLATPTAIMVGLGRVASKGIVIKGAKTVEQLSGIKTFVFDKTGTLTTGNFKINEIKLFNNKNEDEAKQIIYSLEQHSSHPIAQSILNALPNTTAKKLYNIEEIKGKGIKGFDENNQEFYLGSNKILHEENNNFDLYLTQNNQLIAALNIEDEIKPEAKEVIEFLQKNNFDVILLSGDSEKKCQFVARKLNISKVHAAVSPEEKLTLINKLTQEQPTAMVGDGINDAPALAKATIGVSLSNASEAAIDSAQVILLKGNLTALVEAIQISKFTFSTIKQNLFWALSYNLVAIPIAAAGFLNPMVAALSMAFSDVVVIGNSLLLKWKKLN